MPKKASIREKNRMLEAMPHMAKASNNILIKPPMRSESAQSLSLISQPIDSGRHVDNLVSVGRDRMNAAIVSGIFGFLAMGFLGLKGFDFKDMNNTVSFRFFITLLIAHVVESMVIAYLAYTLFSAAERLLLPDSLLKGEPGAVSTIRTILGIRSPVHAALDVDKLAPSPAKELQTRPSTVETTQESSKHSE